MIYTGISSFLDSAHRFPVIDVRSPGEYNQGHIPDSFNIPLFDDRERATVGTIYNHEGRHKAIQKGFALATPKREKLIKSAVEKAIEKKVLIHCWRGGMRSEKMAELFETAGLECTVLEGGYKAYRKKVFEDFRSIENLLVLFGPTGSGKTGILQKLAIMGEQVIDLEYHARHRGSAFGDIGLDTQPTSMQFQNDVHRCLLAFDKTQRIWVEGESMNIGKVYLPPTLWEKMNLATVVNIEMPAQQRVKRIVEEYGRFPDLLLMESVKKLTKRIGGDRTQSVIRLIGKGNYAEAVQMLLDYYDKNYQYSLNKYNQGKIISLTTRTSDINLNAKLILRTLNETGPHE